MKNNFKTFILEQESDINEGLGALAALPKEYSDHLVQMWGAKYGENSIIKQFTPDKIDKVNTEINAYIKANIEMITFASPNQSAIILYMADKDGKPIGMYSRYLEERNWAKIKTEASDYKWMKLPSTISSKDIIETLNNEGTITLIGIDPVRIQKSADRYKARDFTDANFAQTYGYNGKIQPRFLGSKVKVMLNSGSSEKDSKDEEIIDGYISEIKEKFKVKKNFEMKTAAERLLKFIGNLSYDMYTLDIKDNQYYTYDQVKNMLKTIKK